MRCHSVQLVTLCLLIGCGPGEDTSDSGEAPALEPFDEAVAARMEAALDQILVSDPAPGIQVAVSLPGRELWVGQAGLSSLDPEEAWPTGQSSKAGSVTKTLVAALTLRAVDEGALALDDGVADHLADFPWGEPVTVRHLLQHSSGIPDYAVPLETAGDQDERWALADLVQLVADEPLGFEPGSAFSYSNTNYVLLGLLLEAAYGLPWQEQANALLAGVDGGLLRVPAVGEGWGEIVPGYLILPDGTAYEHDAGADWTAYWHPEAIASAGALVADAPGLAAWGRALWIDQTVLDPATVLTMVEEAVRIDPGRDYGLGVVVDQTVEPPRWFHNGAVTGHVAWLEARPEDGAVVALMSNCWLVEGSSFSPDWDWSAREALWAALDGEE